MILRSMRANVLKSMCGVVSWSLLAMTFLALSGCERGVDVKISGHSGRPIFSFENNQLFSSKLPCFTSISVRRAFVDRAEVVWSISSAPKCITLSSLEYGRLPNGFRVLIPANNLDENQDYLVRASGDGWAGGGVFRYRDGSYTFVSK